MQQNEVAQEGTPEMKRRMAEQPDTMMEEDPIKMLTSQHREVEALFSELEGTSERAGKQREKLFNTLAERLLLHALIEEKVFYPAAMEADQELVFEAREEHANATAMIKKIQKTDVRDETYTAKIKVLKELVRHHVQEEEEKMFPKIRETMSEEDLQDLGMQLMERMEQLEEKFNLKRRGRKLGRAKH